MTGVIGALAGSGTAYGAATVTVGYTFVGAGRFNYGFQGSNGSITPATWYVSGTAFVDAIYVTFDGANWVDFRVSGSQPNSGWTNVNIDGSNWARSAASYTSTSSDTVWIWFSPPLNPFGTTIGAKKVMIWT